MDQIKAMRAFLAVADHGSFSAAARATGASPPAVTRDVAALEARLDCKLLVRTTRHVRLTEAGARYSVDARRILHELEEAEAALQGSLGALSGRVVLTAPTVFGRLHVAPHVLACAKAHPGITFELLLLDRMVDLIEEGVDIAVRIADLPDSSVTAQRVGAMGVGFYAAPDYLAAAGAPETPEAFEALDAVVLRAGETVWRLGGESGMREVRLRPRFTTNNIDAAIAAASAGLGVVRLLAYQAAAPVASGALTPVLAGHAPPSVPVHVIHHGGMRGAPKRFRAVIDWLATGLRREPILRGSD